MKKFNWREPWTSEGQIVLRVNPRFTMRDGALPTGHNCYLLAKVSGSFMILSLPTSNHNQWHLRPQTCCHASISVPLPGRDWGGILHLNGGCLQQTVISAVCIRRASSLHQSLISRVCIRRTSSLHQTIISTVCRLSHKGFQFPICEVITK